MTHENETEDSDGQMDEDEESDNTSDHKSVSSSDDGGDFDITAEAAPAEDKASSSSSTSPCPSPSLTTASDSSNSSSSSSDDSDSSEEDDDEKDDDYEPINEKLTLRKDKHSSGKWKLLSDKNAFKKDWLSSFDWVAEHPEDPKLAVCWKCNTTLKAQKGILEAHSKCKKHLRSIGVQIDDPPKKEPQPQQQATGAHQEQFYDHIGLFTESPADAAHQAVTNLIDKLVDKYHENRLINLKIQNQALLRLNMDRAFMVRGVNDRKLERQKQKEAYSKEIQESKIRYIQIQHEIKLHAMEDERDKKIKAVEQELMFAKQEYEKKVRLLDSQICNMK